MTISIKNFIRASRNNIAQAQCFLSNEEALRAEAKRITGDARKTGWLRRDARQLLRVCAQDGITTKKPYKIAMLGEHRALMTVCWPDSNGNVLIPAKFFK